MTAVAKTNENVLFTKQYRLISIRKTKYIVSDINQTDIPIEHLVVGIIHERKNAECLSYVVNLQSMWLDVCS